MSLPTTATVQRDVDAPPDVVHALLVDLPRMPQWSPEVQRLEWSGPERGVGATFVARNRRGPFTWRTRGRVERLEPDRTFAFVTLHRGRPATRWTYRLEARRDGGTTVTERFDAEYTPLLFRLLERTVLRHRQQELEAGMQTTLANLAAAASSAAAARS